ncbi:hypothetical protein [Diaphorobacter caeni]|uniref:hypothetical protein n=1 Tax=Diaphorobacter caeni TaxID=2784387 RepID=UPI00188EE958|nr:hypothetical protein [Diaphorobacter caeni]MBF5003569.1 hypothetical protein [Diaphorobacter caeni]
MNKTVASSVNHWIAAGVQHAVLSRTMPALRHDLAGSVSVLRMGMAVISRKLETSAEPLSREEIAPRLLSIESGINDLNQGLRRLRHWDKQSHELLNARDLLGEIWELSRPFLALRCIEQSPLADADAAAWPRHPIPPQPLMYLLLASIYHLAEGTDSVPQRIAVTPDDECLHLVAEGLAPSSGVPDVLRSDGPLNTPPIDRTGLLCLAEHLQRRIEFTSAQSVLIHLG